MSTWKKRGLAVLAGIAISVVAVVVRDQWYPKARPGFHCEEGVYDHVAFLAAIDEGDLRARNALTLLRQPGATQDPIAQEQIAYFESKRSHFQVLSNVVTKYVRGGHVKKIHCLGDQFLSLDLLYPSFKQIERDKSFAEAFKMGLATQRTSWVTTLISLCGAVLGPTTTLLIFVLAGKRERERADQRITVATTLPR